LSETTGPKRIPAGRRLTVRRGTFIGATLPIVSAIVFMLGISYLWPLFAFPLVLAAIFFFELGSLLVTAWLGAFFVAYYSLVAPLTTAATKQAIAGTTMFAVVGLLLGRVQRHNNEAQATLAASSLNDPLTGLYNYGTFVDSLHNEITKVDRYGGELTLIMLDLDNFKQFNDRYGHESGNELLRRVGTTMRATVREADMPARYGGEEFAVLISGDVAHGYELAERLRDAIEASFIRLHDGSEACTTVSSGVASYPSSASTEAELVERSDAALYESKRRGRNRVTIYAGASEAGIEAAPAAALSA